MKVYIVLQEVDYSISELLGVYSNLDNAITFVENIVKDLEDYTFFKETLFWSGHVQSYGIREMDVIDLL